MEKAVVRLIFAAILANYCPVNFSRHRHYINIGKDLSSFHCLDVSE